MAKALLGKKIGMMHVWNDAGKQLPVTVVEAGPCSVLQIKNAEKEGYNSIQIGFEELKEKHADKATQGHQSNSKEKTGSYYRHLIEVRDYPESVNVGDTLSCALFEKGESVYVSGTGKGKGFQGVVKRYGFHGGRKTHGSTFHRSTGAISAGTYPGRVNKGKKMPGRMGGKTVTIKNVDIVDILPEKNLILLKGTVPGPKGSLVKIYS